MSQDFDTQIKQLHGHQPSKGWRILISMMAFILLGSHLTSAQTASIKPGKYICYAPAYGAMIAMPNPQLGIVWVPSVTYNPSVIGNIVISASKTYSMPTAKWNGAYTIDQATGKLTVTGGLKKASTISYVSNGSWIFIQIDGLKNECYLDGKRQANGGQATENVSPEAQAKRKRLIYGSFLVTSSNIRTDFGGKVYTWNLQKDTQETLFPSGQANRSLNGEVINVDKNGRLVIADSQGRVIDDLTGKIRFPGRGMIVQLVNPIFVNPALSANGDKIALSLAKVGDFGADYGRVVVVIDRKGNKLAEFDGYAQTAWLPDGRLIITGSYYGNDLNGKRGLYITDAQLKNLTPLAKELEAASQPDVSKDGKKVVFWVKDTVWTVNTDGTNLKKVYKTKGGVLHPAWSPRGDAIICLDNSYSSNGGLEFVIIDLETGDSFVIADGKGNRPTAEGKVVWYEK